MNRTIFSAPALATALAMSGAHDQAPLAEAWAAGAAQPSSETRCPRTEAASKGSAPGEENAAPSDTDLETFTDIYAELQQANEKFLDGMAAARTEKEARAVSAERERASLAALSSHGWTRSKFDRIGSAINANPVLVERAIELLEGDC